jgi:hypothetical protein
VRDPEASSSAKGSVVPVRKSIGDEMDDSEDGCCGVTVSEPLLVDSSDRSSEGALTSVAVRNGFSTTDGADPTDESVSVLTIDVRYVSVLPVSVLPVPVSELLTESR